jgi:hypothetical protein
MINNCPSNCPSCGLTNFQIEDAAPPHNQKLICLGCDRFLKWIPSPKNIDRHRELKNRLENLKDKVNGWEAIFVNGLIKNLRISERDGKIFKLSPRQSEFLEKIEGKFLTVNPHNSVVEGGAR